MLGKWKGTEVGVEFVSLTKSWKSHCVGSELSLFSLPDEAMRTRNKYREMKNPKKTPGSPRKQSSGYHHSTKTTMESDLLKSIVSAHQFHLHHSSRPSLLYSFISASEHFFSINSSLHRPLVPSGLISRII